MYEEISQDRYYSLLSMMSYLENRKKYKHNRETIMEGMISINWVSEFGEIIYPVIFSNCKKFYLVEHIKYMPYRCQLNNYK